MIPAGAALAPPPEATVRVLGRALPRASGTERIAWAIIVLGVACVLGLAATLNPDPRGVGTHEQIWLGRQLMPPCGFIVVTGIPCPSCGFTTTFALAAHGRFLEAARNQPFGFFVFLGFCASVPVGLGAVVKGFSPMRATDHWRWRWIMIGFIAFWLLGWVYKIRLLQA